MSKAQENPDAASVTTELPVITLGHAPDPEHVEQEHDPPKRRVLLGRVHPSAVFYPIYLLLIISGGIVANVALDTGEWSFTVVVIAWSTLFLWNWMYVVSWTYSRRMLKYTSVLAMLTLQGGMAAACYDRGQPQLVFKQDVIARQAIPSLNIAAGILLVCLLLMLAHLLYLGRGYRAKRA